MFQSNKKLLNIGISIFSLIAICFFGYNLLLSKMERPVPKTQTIAKHFKVSNVNLLGQVSTDLLHTSPYYYAYEAKKDGKQIIIIVDQYFGRAGKDNPLVEKSYIFVYPQSEANIQDNNGSDIISNHRIEVSDGQSKYESTVDKKILYNDGTPVTLVFVTKDNETINTYSWGLKNLIEKF
ncbi:hypothetical protein GQF01_28000 [Paenibacillus sp. 5J-6]|uniref:Uncharacterized protein n=2 Tax=Paenibacillus silvestris TaxID=2606219 RepID=A0A6L8V9P9_9BACL|nr:hypothetical protein [Paenibacillus silvestris]